MPSGCKSKPSKVIDGIEHKCCTKCNKWKEVKMYYRCLAYCKDCHKKWRQKNNKKKPWLEQKRLKRLRERYKNDPNYREKMKKKSKKRWHTDARYREREKKRMREKYENNFDLLQQKRKKERNRYQNDHVYRERQLERKKQLHHERYKIDPVYTTMMLLRGRLRSAIQLNLKSDLTKRLLGKNINSVTVHLEKQFHNYMSWRNKGGKSGWHLDHRIPCKAWDFNSPVDQHVCFWYKNLQPLWAKDNLSKGAKYKEEDKQALIKEWIFYHT